MTALPFSEFQYDSVADVYFSLSFNDTLLTDIHSPGRYEYEYLKADHKPTKDGWTSDPFDIIRRLNASIVSNYQKSKELFKDDKSV